MDSRTYKSLPRTVRANSGLNIAVQHDGTSRYSHFKRDHTEDAIGLYSLYTSCNIISCNSIKVIRPCKPDCHHYYCKLIIHMYRTPIHVRRPIHSGLKHAQESSILIGSGDLSAFRVTSRGRRSLLRPSKACRLNVLTLYSIDPSALAYKGSSRCIR